MKNPHQHVFECINVQKTKFFLRFSFAPHLVATAELMPNHKLFWTEDPTESDGRKIQLIGATNNLVQYLAKGMNFT